MMSQPMTNETIAVLTAHGITFPQTENPRPTTQTQASLKKRLNSEANVFGAIQILCGAMVLSLGIILAAAPAAPYFTTDFSTLIRSAYPFVGALCFIVSGSLLIIKEKKPTKPLGHSSLACSLLSAALALAGVALLSYTLAALESAFQQCELSKMSRPTTSSYFYYHRDEFSNDCSTAKASLMGTASVMLICTALELCLAVLTAVLCWTQARSDFSGGVLFQPHTYKNNPGMLSKTRGDPGYEELVTP